jgi:hypothetical protein
LKQNALPGLAWDVFVGGDNGRDNQDGVLLLEALNALNGCPCVLRAGWVSDHLRAITPADVTKDDLLERLFEAGFSDVHLEQVEPTLEDVFLALAARD